LKIILRPESLDDYKLFLRIKGLPRYSFRRNIAEVPDEYAGALGLAPSQSMDVDYEPIANLFDYQEYCARLSIFKRKFGVYLACGYGKTFVLAEFVRHVARVLSRGRCVLILSPLMVIEQTLEVIKEWYGKKLPIVQISAADLPAWLASGKERIGITNYESVRDGIDPGRLGSLALDESSMLASAYGRHGQRILEWGKGLNWKICLSGLPAPNDRIEYANTAVFLDQFPNVNAFLARFFVNRGQTQNRWEMKPHALRPFYTALSHFCIFMNNPAAYGFKDNAQGMPPIKTHIHDIELTAEQIDLSVRHGGDMFGTPGGITSRATLARLAKGHYKGQRIATNKTAFIQDLIASWPEESTLVWTKYNDEQEQIAAALPGCGNITGTTPHAERQRIINAFQKKTIKVLVSKPACLGMGLNLQVATRQVFSTAQDSLAEFHQAVKRSNRVGSTQPLNVHLPITSLERVMLENILAKAKRVEEDTAEQESLFKECRDSIMGSHDVR